MARFRFSSKPTRRLPKAYNQTCQAPCALPALLLRPHCLPNSCRMSEEKSTNFTVLCTRVARNLPTEFGLLVQMELNLHNHFDGDRYTFSCARLKSPSAHRSDCLLV